MELILITTSRDVELHLGRKRRVGAGQEDSEASRLDNESSSGGGRTIPGVQGRRHERKKKLNDETRSDEEEITASSTALGRCEVTFNSPARRQDNHQAGWWTWWFW